MPSDPPDPSDAAVLARLRKTLTSNGYRSGDVDDMITQEGAAAYFDGWYNPVRRRTESHTPLASLVRLFALGLDVLVDDLDSVHGADLSDWVGAGFVAVRRRTVHPLVAIRPVRMWGAERLLACDAPQPGLTHAPFVAAVRGVTPPSTVLAKLTLRQPFSRALDMGTGDGFQAILASRHCREVVATDVNARALAFARFNLAWNEVDNVELRLGDRYEPVDGELFDLVVCNPPFLVSPTMSALFLDSELPTDMMSATAVRGAAEHVAPGGWAFVTGQWVLHDGERWQDRVENWVAGTGCDAWAVQRHMADPVAHAAKWLDALGKADPKEADRQFEVWMRYLDAEGIVGVGSGFVVLRESSGRPSWFRSDELGDEPGDDAGVAIAALFGTQDWLVAHPGPGAVLDASWRLAEGLRLDTTQDVIRGRQLATKYLLRLGTGLRSSVEISKDLAEIVTRCDGTQRLSSILGAHVQGRWRDTERYESAIEAAFRQLVEAGFAVPVTEPS